MTEAPQTELADEREFVPCPFCKQYSHSIGDDRLAEAFRHFQSMYAHPIRGTPMGDIFDEKTRDAAQVLMAAASRPSPLVDTEALRAEIADLRSRLEIVNITVDQQPFKVKRETFGFAIYSLVRNTNDCHLARETATKDQAEDIDDLFAPLIVNDGDSFVTFPSARFG